jgi:hypothetical protein
MVTAVNASGSSNSSIATGSTSACATAPTITSPTAASFTVSGATLGGNVTSDGGSAVTGRGVCVGTGANPAVGGNCFSTSGTTGVFTINATGLTQGTLYHYRAYATNSIGTNYTTDDTFNTSGPPIVTTSAAGSVGNTSAVLGSVVNPSGASTNINYLWGTASEACSLLPNTLTGPTALTGTSNISPNATTLPSLSPNATYYFCVMATNTYGTTYGSVLSFTTSPTIGAYTYMDAGSVLGGGATDCYDDSGVPCPAAMGGVSAPAYNLTSINWSAAAGPAPTSYDIYYCTGSNSCTPSSLLGNTGSTSGSQSTSASTWYGYNIVAKNAIGSAKSSSGNAYVQTPAACTNGYTDYDRDGYGGQGTFGCYNPSGSYNIVANGTDCYDSNANAYPGSTWVSSTNRGDGIFDYNCDNVITYTTTNTYYATNGPFTYYGSTWYSNSGCFGYSTYPPNPSVYATSLGYGTPACGTYMSGWSGYYSLYTSSSCASLLGYGMPSQQSCK